MGHPSFKKTVHDLLNLTVWFDRGAPHNTNDIEYLGTKQPGKLSRFLWKFKVLVNILKVNGEDIYSLKVNCVSYHYQLMLRTSKLFVDFKSKIYTLLHETIQISKYSFLICC